MTQEDQDHENIFQPILERFQGASGEDFDEDEYWKLMKELEENGVEDFLAFLQTVLCTFPAVNDFLVHCLYVATQQRDKFDT